MDITINETAPSNVVLDFSSVIQEAENITYMPGAIQKFKVHIKNQSGKNYQYKDGSFVLSTADTDDFGTLEEGALLRSWGMMANISRLLRLALCSPNISIKIFLGKRLQQR